MKINKILGSFIGLVLIVSAIAKLSAISYVSTILFLLLPLQWMGTWIASNLSLLVITISIIELLLGFLLWSRYQQKILHLVAGFLLLMLLINSYQWYSGVKDCACFGIWLQVSPKVTFLKTLFMLFATGFLISSTQEFISFSKLIKYTSQF
jgi:hypothetical protein